MDKLTIGTTWTYDDFVVEIITREHADSLRFDYKTGDVLYLYKSGVGGNRVKVGSFQTVDNFLKVWSPIG